jgi:hypothetical protein
MRVAGKSGPGLTEATNIFPGIYDVDGYLTRLTPPSGDYDVSM